MLVWGAVEVATAFGVSDLVIGLTIVAIGTSLPELAASIMSALKNEHDLAIGNVVGSNHLEPARGAGHAGAARTRPDPAEVISRDMLVMLALTLALFIMGRSQAHPWDHQPARRRTAAGLLHRLPGLADLGHARGRRLTLDRRTTNGAPAPKSYVKTGVSVVRIETDAIIALADRIDDGFRRAPANSCWPARAASS